MTVRKSTGLQKAIIDSGFGPAFDTSGVIRIYTGAQPTHADDAPSGTLLGTLTMSADAFAAATGTTYNNCQAAANSITDDSSADNSGDAGWFRLCLSADAGGSSTSNKRLDGSCDQGAGDMSFDNKTIVAGGVIHCSGFTYTNSE